jgi:hypothetical protein
MYRDSLLGAMIHPAALQDAAALEHRLNQTLASKQNMRSLRWSRSITDVFLNLVYGAQASEFSEKMCLISLSSTECWNHIVAVQNVWARLRGVSSRLLAATSGKFCTALKLKAPSCSHVAQTK